MPLTEEQYAQAMREHEAACGAATIAWARFEVTLCFYFQSAAQIADQIRARMIWAGLPNLQARRKLLTRFAENYVEDERVLRCFRIFMKRVSKLASKRNMIAHSPSGIIAESGKASFLQFDFGDEDGVFMFYKKLEFEREKMSRIGRRTSIVLWRI